jgi:hypothetical protein
MTSGYHCLKAATLVSIISNQAGENPDAGGVKKVIGSIKIMDDKTKEG